MFQAAIGAYVGTVAESLTNQLIPRLYAINGKTITENTPRFKAGAVSRAALDILGSFVESMSKAGMRTTGDTELENALRKTANLPMLDERGEARTVQDLTAQLDMAAAEAAIAAKPKPTVSKARHELV
jgi:imidazole glycerol phosphate synthase subunit HisF